jgi:pimeloyl-ACP methyl ester carboxylesterase
MSAPDLFCDLPSGIRICYRSEGDPQGLPLLLIAGLGIDLTSWSSEFVDALIAAGFHVVRFDNRDVGRSTRLSTAPPGRVRQLLARPRPEAYDLADMAEDTAGLLEHLGLGPVHVVGMSMGGMIAQTLAARYPDRVRTLTSIFSTTGARRIGQPARSTLLRFAKPPARTIEEYTAKHLSMLAHIGSTDYAADEAAERAYARGAWERAGEHRLHQGVARQISAIQKSGDRTAELRRITAPTLVIHGDRDLMVHPSGGQATVAAVPGASHVVIAGMRHHIGPTLAPRLVQLITEHAAVDDTPATGSASTSETAS